MGDGVVSVVDFKNKQAIDLKDKPVGGCNHMRLSVDPVLRVVECSLCGAKLDPVQVLVEFAKRERRMSYTRQAYEDARKKTQDLSAEERRIKARIRRAEKKLKGIEG